jgi:DNA-binding Xre family transcriptional regulator
VTRKISYHWHLRRLMAERDMYATTALVPPLAERGVTLSREQVYRLVTGTPERLNLHVLAALCDILDCSVGQLIEPFVEQRPVRKSASAASGTDAPRLRSLRPTGARLVPPE